MKEDKLVVSDTNILIDLVRLGQIDLLFGIGWEVTTTDLIIEELEDASQKELIEPYIKSGTLKIKSFSSSETLELMNYFLSVSSISNLSIQDCSVLKYSKETNAILLSGDKKLRTKAEEESITVKGIIYIFDKAVEKGILQEECAADIFDRLLVLNNRLPKKEIQQRIDRLRGHNKKEL